MALGFGFNKAKVLASAEKFVQQGKLQNAIAEYEKIIKDDPKDLTVLNTIGDLYMRVGQTEHATHYFKKVGEQYAQDGFTVKAIAIYKKLSRLAPANTENLNRLAELYTQQGLFNDARAQYMQIADQVLRSGDNAHAARILQRVLELEPESASTQAKLADLYLKLGKKEEALHIFYGAAEALYHRGSLEAAEEALKKVMQIDASNSGALLLRGLIAADLKDGDAAVKYLSQVVDLDKHPEALRALLAAKLQSGNDEGVVAIAEKLLSQYNDSSGLSSVATWYAIHNRPHDAIRLYERYSDKLLTGDAAAMQQTLSPLIERVKDDPPALDQVTRLLKKGGVDTSQSPEIMEAEAHACAQKGEYARARDLYKKLVELEPENALHAQSYRQMLAKLGEDSATRILSPEEAAQAFMVEELDQSAPAVPQSYDPATEKAIEAALTDAELFVSYNVPAKAVPPLESALALAPRDVTVNQRLATLYIRAERYADAARVCQVLSDVFRESGHEKEASGYLEAARKYGLRAGITVATAPAQASRMEAVSEIAPPPAAPEMPVHPILEEIKPIAIAAEEAAASSVQEFSFDVPDHLPMESTPAMQVSSQPIEVLPIEAAPPEIMRAPAAAAQREHEPDHANEWENMLSVEDEVTEPATAPPEKMDEPRAAEIAAEAPASAIADKIQEVHFYISQTLWEEAKRAILDLTEIAPNAPEISLLISAVSAGQSITTAAASAAAGAAPAAADFDVTAPTPAVVAPAAMPVTPPPVMEVPLMQASSPAPEPPPLIMAQPAIAAAEESVLEVSSEPAIVHEAAPEEDILEVQPKKQRKVAAKAKPKSEPAAAGPAGSTEDILTDFVHDLETSDLKDFVPRPVAAETQAPAAPMAHSNGDMQDSESAMVLSDILSDLQEEDATEEEVQEDPETHYNLGIAFKEMGLLDEAIGELQKVCHAMDRGKSFSQPIQVFTWLAQCLVDKGAPEAAVRWYQKALELPGLDSDSRCAIHYDLATAFEASGDKKSALANFMEVYGSNIDFRDVASRIKVLKS